MPLPKWPAMEADSTWPAPEQNHASSWPSDDSFRFESDSASSSGGSTHNTSEDSHDSSNDWRYSGKYWTVDDWAVIADRYLFERGYALHTKAHFASTSSLDQDPDAFFAERASSLDDRCQLYGLRLAFDLRHPYMRSVYVRAIVVLPGSDEIQATRKLMRFRDHPHNFAVATLDIFETCYDGIDIAFIVQEDAGQPSNDFEELFRDERIWRKFVLDCFEGVAFFHSLGIAHLDIGPANVVYNPRTGRPSFIDFEGCQLHEEEVQKHNTQLCARAENSKPQIISRKKDAPSAANARLPELAQPDFDVFAADVWCLGIMLREMRSFPDNDLRAHFRSMCMKEPRARPTMAYALEKLKALLASETDLLL